MANRAWLAAALMGISSCISYAGEKFQFPAGFLWGTATAAHQVEGNNSNSDWWHWELVPGRIKNNDRSGQAVDHYRRYPEDLALAKGLHNNSYRFSIEWARLEPEPGRFDENEVAHYRAVLEECRARGLKPMVTLFHFTLPKWLADKGGWLDPETIGRFERFAAFAGERFGDLTDLWCTLNEPVVYLGAGYVKGVFPPGVQDLNKSLKVMEHMARGHAFAKMALKRTDKTVAYKGAPAAGVLAGPCVVTVAAHLRIFDPARNWHPGDIVAARITDYIFNKAFLNAITHGRLVFKIPGFPHVDVPIAGGRNSIDILGLNYYSRDMIQFNPSSPTLSDQLLPPNAPVSDLNWEIYPEGFYRLLMSTWNDYKLPIVITENGVADSNDNKRTGFLRDHLRAMARAMKDGVPVLGYMHWSLVDNFEWAEGFWPRFGLFKIDYATQQRKPTKAAELYREVARTNSIDLGDEQDFDPEVPAIPEATAR